MSDLSFKKKTYLNLVTSLMIIAKCLYPWKLVRRSLGSLSISPPPFISICRNSPWRWYLCIGRLDSFFCEPASLQVSQNDRTFEPLILILDRGSSASLMISSALRYPNRLYQTSIGSYIGLVVAVVVPSGFSVGFLADFLALAARTSGLVTPLMG